MGYLFLAISLLAGITKGYCGKKTSGYVNGYSGAMLANFVRMFFCIVIGFVMILIGENLKLVYPDTRLLVISAVSGISTSIFVVCWLISFKKGAYMMLDVFLMLGVLVPISAGYILFSEKIKTTQWLGILILIIAAFIMCSYNNSIKEKLSFSSFCMLLICGGANGTTDFMQKLFVKELPQVPVSIFNFYTYLFSAAVLGVFYILLRTKERKNGEAEGVSEVKHIMGYIAIMSVCLFANSFFKTKAAAYLDSVQLYPLNQGLSLTLSTIMAAVLFHEKMTWKCILGLLLAFAGLVVINML